MELTGRKRAKIAETRRYQIIFTSGQLKTGSSRNNDVNLLQTVGGFILLEIVLEVEFFLKLTTIYQTLDFSSKLPGVSSLSLAN